MGHGRANHVVPAGLLGKIAERAAMTRVTYHHMARSRLPRQGDCPPHGVHAGGVPESMIGIEHPCRGARLLELKIEHGGRLFRELTIEENLLTPLRYHFGPNGGGGADWVGTVLSKSGLERLKDQRPAGLGVAYSQRAALARALVLRPEVLLLDNPLALLESSQAHWWIEFLHELSRGADWLDGRPLTLAITTDDLRPWRQQQSGLNLALLGPSRWEVYSSGNPWSNLEDRLMQELLAANLQPRQNARRESSR
jgi:hypothetical protein